MPTQSTRGIRAIQLALPDTDVTVYAGARTARAMTELMEDMNLYSGVRFAQVAKAIYEQGLRDGRRQVFEHIDKGIEDVKQDPQLRHRNPGRPATQTVTKKAAPAKTSARKKAGSKTTVARRITRKTVGRTRRPKTAQSMHGSK